MELGVRAATGFCYPKSKVRHRLKNPLLCPMTNYAGISLSSVTELHVSAAPHNVLQCNEISIDGQSIGLVMIHV